MTLPRLLAAALAVGAWFLLASFVEARLARRATLTGRTARVRLAEALLLTLFGSLWFDSLGHGEWWLLFALVGALSALATHAAQGAQHWHRTSVAVAVDIARYVIAGGILAWRLG